MWNRTQRFKGIDRVMEEFRMLKKLGVGQVFIVDDNYGGNVARDVKIFQSLLEEGMEFEMSMFCRVDTAHRHPELVETAGRAGVREVLRLHAGQ